MHDLQDDQGNFEDNNYSKRFFQAFLGPLPPTFLRIEETMTGNQQEEADRQAAFALQQMQNQAMAMMGRLTITVVQVRLSFIILLRLLIIMKHLFKVEMFKSVIFCRQN